MPRARGTSCTRRNARSIPYKTGCNNPVDGVRAKAAGWNGTPNRAPLPVAFSPERRIHCSWTCFQHPRPPYSLWNRQG